MTNDSAIRVEDLHKTYRSGMFGGESLNALCGVSFEIPRGQIFGLLGPNGAGKTTLIKVLLGIVRGTRGEASLLGFSAGDRRGRRHVGYLPEGHRIPAHHTGETALEFLGALSGMSYRDIRARRHELLDRVGLSKWGKTPIRKYSKGMQQRLGLAQAMLHDPELLILDEPTDGVDPVGRSEMRELLNELRAAGKTIFINSHLLQEVELICDKVGILHSGVLRREATIRELTELSGGRIRFRIVGEEPAIRSLSQLLCQPIDGSSSTLHAHTESGVWDLDCPVRDQSDVDRYIDQIRCAGISIRALMPLRRTLEEAFLDIIQSDVPSPLSAVHPQGSTSSSALRPEPD